MGLSSMWKNKARMCIGKLVTLSSMIREDFTQNVTFEHRLGGHEEMCHVDALGKNISGRGNDKEVVGGSE